MAQKNIELIDFLAQLFTQLDTSKSIYTEYLTNEKRYSIAKSLFHSNTQVKTILVNKSHLLPDNLQPHATKLLEHLNTWLMLWNTLDDSKMFQPDEKFIFENSTTFPRDSVSSIEHFYTKHLNKTP